MRACVCRALTIKLAQSCCLGPDTPEQWRVLAARRNRPMNEGDNDRVIASKQEARASPNRMQSLVDMVVCVGSASAEERISVRARACTYLHTESLFLQNTYHIKLCCLHDLHFRFLCTDVTWHTDDKIRIRSFISRESKDLKKKRIGHAYLILYMSCLVKL